MNTIQLVWKNISKQIGSTALSILLTAFGVAILCVLSITSDSFEKQLEKLKQAAVKGDNVFEILMETTKYASLGQITQALFEVGGQYRRNM